MNANQPPTPRSPLHRPARLARTFVARAFTVSAFCATFFGLAMLVIFFARLGVDVARWFRAMPPLVAEHNERLAAQAAQARNFQSLVDRETEQINQEMKLELEAATSDEGKAEIRELYKEILASKLADLKLTAGEIVADESHIRPHTGPAALLGHFFTAAPSSEPQDAGILPALLGSLSLGLITLLVAVPLGVGAAVYLEEHRHSNLLARIIQININNLAGVPSVLYGILGGFVFVEMIFKPLESQRIAARNLLGGGCTLALLTLPVIIVSAQEAIRAVPPSLRHGAFALGATRWQVVWHVVLPAAMPGVLTGIILALCRALGEAAPLVMFGALQFVNHNPSLFSPFTALPLQIFNWSQRPDDAWRYNAALASAVLVLTLLALNGTAIFLRQRAQRHMKW